MSNVKRCARCEEERDIDLFLIDKRGYGAGRGSYCKSCRAAYHRDGRKTSPGKYRGWDNARYERDSVKIRTRVTERYKQHSASIRQQANARYNNSPLLQTRQTWWLIQQRCHNVKHHAYSYYGGRGISVCQEWRDSFEKFVSHVGLRPQGLSIDRIDNDKGYEPGNVRWATHSEQMRNRRLPKSSIPTCLCGSCRKCKQRESKRKLRERRRGY